MSPGEGEDPWRFPYANDLIAARAPLAVLKKRRITERLCESCELHRCGWVVFSYDLPGGFTAAWIVCDDCAPPEAETVRWHVRHGRLPGDWWPCPGGPSCDHSPSSSG